MSIVTLVLATQQCCTRALINSNRERKSARASIAELMTTASSRFGFPVERLFTEKGDLIADADEIRDCEGTSLTVHKQLIGYQCVWPVFHLSVRPQCFSVCLPCSQGDAVSGEGSLLAGRTRGGVLSVSVCVCRVLRAMLSLGKGRSWQDGLEVMFSVFQCIPAVFSGRCCLWGRVAPGRTPWRWCPQCFSVCVPCSQSDAVAGEGSLLAGRPGGDVLSVSVYVCAVFSGRCCLWGRVAPGRTVWR